MQQAARKSRHKRLEHVQELRNRRDAIANSNASARDSLLRVRAERAAAEERLRQLRERLARKREKHDA